MAQLPKLFKQDLTQDVKVRHLATKVFNADDLSNVITVECYNGSEPATLSGSVVGAVICSDGSTVPVTNGTVSGNTVTMTLTAACFAIPGPIGVGIQLVSGNVKTTIFKAVYGWERFATDNVVDPDSRITLQIGDLVAAIDTAIEAIPTDYSMLMKQVGELHTPTDNAYTWERGTIDRTTGIEGPTNSRLRTPAITAYPVALIPDSGYKTEVFVYAADDTYLGILQLDGTLGTTACWYNHSVNVLGLGGGYVRILLAIDIDGSSTEITLAESVHLKVAKMTDATLTQSGKAADAKAAGDRMSALETEFSLMDEIAKAETAQVSNSETWSRGTLNPSTGGSSDSTSTSRIRTAWSGENIPLGVEPVEGYKVAVYVKVDGTYQGVIQADGSIAKANYFATNAVWIKNISNVTDVRYQLAKTDDSDIALAAGVNLLFRVYTDATLSQAGKAADAKAVSDVIDRDSALHNLLYSGEMLIGYTMTSNPSTATTPAANDVMNTSDYIAVKGGETIACHGFRRYWWFDSNKAVVSNSSTGNLTDKEVFDAVSGAKLLKAPQSAAYIRVSYKARGNEQGEADTDVYLYRPTPYDQFLYGNLYAGAGKKYIALGSSLVAGTYSEIGNPQSIGSNPNMSFVRWIAEYNGYVITNLGAGGQGWINPSNASNQSVCDVIDENYQPNADPPVNNFSDAEIITLTLGTNDYKAQWKAADSDPHEWTLGSVADTPAKNSTVIAAMRYALEKLITAAPQAQIVVTLPGNFKKLGVATSGVDYGSEIDVVDGRLYAKETNNWALGTHNHENKTLADYKAAIKECAEYCGVRTVDVGSICAANRYNMDSMLGDGIHPTEEYYKLMGYSLAPFIK